MKRGNAINKNALISICSAVIKCALLDIKSRSRRYRAERNDAKRFIFSEDCELFCFVINMNYENLKQKAIELYNKGIERKKNDKRYVYFNYIDPEFKKQVQRKPDKVF